MKPRQKQEGTESVLGDLAHQYLPGHQHWMNLEDTLSRCRPCWPLAVASVSKEKGHQSLQTGGFTGLASAPQEGPVTTPTAHQHKRTQLTSEHITAKQSAAHTLLFLLFSSHSKIIRPLMESAGCPAVFLPPRGLRRESQPLSLPSSSGCAIFIQNLLLLPLLMLTFLSSNAVRIKCKSQTILLRLACNKGKFFYPTSTPS